MTDHIQTLQEDIGFLRALAQDGGGRGLAGGAWLVDAGVVFGLGSLGQWAVTRGLVPTFGGWTSAAVWAAAMATFLAIGFAAQRGSGKRNLADAGARASATAWAALGWSIFVLIGCLQLIVWRTHSLVAMAVVPSVILSLYGAGWSVAASVARRRWMWAAAVGAFGAALGAAWLCTSPNVYLWYAAALFLIVAAPGAAMMRAYRAGA